MIPFLDLKPQYQVLQQEILHRIKTVLEHGRFINGPEVTELEEKLAQFVGVKHALTCASGTDALLIPLMALGIGPGDEVITTSFSFVATAEVIYLVGATPVFVDIDLETYNLDLNQVTQAISPRTKAIIPVSLFGQTPDLETLEKICHQKGIFLIEDGAQSFGASLNQRYSGSFGTVGTTSFYPAKPLGCYGDGGAIFTNDSDLFTRMKQIREHGSEKRYYHTRLGINGRLDTLQCAILLAKLERYPKEMELRQLKALKYQKGFSDLQSRGLRLPNVLPQCRSVWAQYTLAHPKRDFIRSELEKLNVPTDIHYPRIIPDQPWYQSRLTQSHQSWPKARQAAQEVFSLPLYADLPDQVQDHIIDSVRKVCFNL